MTMRKAYPPLPPPLDETRVFQPVVTLIAAAISPTMCGGRNVDDLPHCYTCGPLSCMIGQGLVLAYQEVPFQNPKMGGAVRYW